LHGTVHDGQQGGDFLCIGVIGRCGLEDAFELHLERGEAVAWPEEECELIIRIQ
jgi:hypothetical protein